MYKLVRTYISLSYNNSYRFNALVSSALNFWMSLSSLSRQPLPFNSTDLSAVEKTSLNLAAIWSHSAGFEGRHATTSLANAMSCQVSGHLKAGITLQKCCRRISEVHIKQLSATVKNGGFSTSVLHEQAFTSDTTVILMLVNKFLLAKRGSSLSGKQKRHRSFQRLARCSHVET